LKNSANEKESELFAWASWRKVPCQVLDWFPKPSWWTTVYRIRPLAYWLCSGASSSIMIWHLLPHSKMVKFLITLFQRDDRIYYIIFYNVPNIHRDVMKLKAKNIPAARRIV
jgi:hypothetical protein